MTNVGFMEGIKLDVEVACSFRIENVLKKVTKKFGFGFGYPKTRNSTEDILMFGPEDLRTDAATRGQGIPKFLQVHKVTETFPTESTG